MNAIDILANKYDINENEIFYLKNIKSNKFLNSYEFDSNRQQYKYILEKFTVKNNKLYALSDINNKDIVVTECYISGISEQIINGKLIAVKEENMDNVNYFDKYEDKITYNNNEIDWKK